MAENAECRHIISSSHHALQLFAALLQNKGRDSQEFRRAAEALATHSGERKAFSSEVQDWLPRLRLHFNYEAAYHGPTSLTPRQREFSASRDGNSPTTPKTGDNQSTRSMDSDAFGSSPLSTVTTEEAGLAATREQSSNGDIPLSPADTRTPLRNEDVTGISIFVRSQMNRKVIPM